MVAGPVIVGIVPAGGGGRRMGGVDKAALLVGGIPLLDRVLAAARPVCDRLVVVGPRRPTSVHGAEFVIEDQPGGGPVPAVVAGLAVAGDCDIVLVLAADLPLLTARDLRRLVAALDAPEGRADAATAAHGRSPHPLLAAYRADALRESSAGLGPGSAAGRLLPPTTVTVDLGPATLNVNSPDDLAAAERLATGAVAGEVDLHSALVADRPETVDALLLRMDALLAPLEERKDPLRLFLATYRRTTLAVRDMAAAKEFTDTEWVERWDVAFANLYLDAVDAWEAGRTPPGPWAAAFRTTREGPRLPPLRHLLLGMNAHINYDLPQSLLAVITDDEFDDEAMVARRAADHARMDQLLVDRVGPEDAELAKVEEPGDRTWLDRALTPFNRAGTKRFLKESRGKVWRNAKLLSAARRQGPEALAARTAELDRLSEARIADLRVPGQVLLKLSIKGFGVELAAPEP